MGCQCSINKNNDIIKEQLLNHETNSNKSNLKNLNNFSNNLSNNENTIDTNFSRDFSKKSAKLFWSFKKMHYLCTRF